MDDLTPAPIGHNIPPPFDPDRHTDLAGRVEKFMDACNKVRTDGPIENDERAQFLADHIAGMRGLKKRVEDTKKLEKKPHDEAGKAVVAAYSPLEERLERAIKAMLAIQNDWLDKKRAEAEAEQERKRAEAEAIKRAAEEAAAKAAETGNIDAEIEAEKLVKEAAKAEKAAGREIKTSVGSATGAGRTISQRTVRKAEIQNISALFVRYRAHPKLIECLQSLADADVRAKEITEANAAIYGVKIIEAKVAA
jgi:predicted metal-dependent hydrolase